MTEVTIRNRVQSRFGIVPNALWQAPLSTRAKVCMAYLCCLQDGSPMPFVSQVEQATGLGRDARRQAFGELQAVGLIEWKVQRDPATKAIRHRFLTVDHGPLEALAAGEKGLAPENQAVGQTEAGESLPPENPAGGFSVGAATETRRCSDGKSGDLNKKREKQERAAKARSAERKAQPPRSPHESGGAAAPEAGKVEDLSRFQASMLRERKPVLIGGAMIRPDTPTAERLLAQLRGQSEQQAERQALRGAKAENESEAGR